MISEIKLKYFGKELTNNEWNNIFNEEIKLNYNLYISNSRILLSDFGSEKQRVVGRRSDKTEIKLNNRPIKYV